MPGKIAYIMSRFPHLPETFILREMIALEQLGRQIELYPLIIQHQTLVHKEASPWIARARYVPWLSRDVFMANFHYAINYPDQYFSLLWRTFLENMGNPKFLVRTLALFPKAVWMAKKFKEDEISHIHAHYATHPAFVAWVINQLTGISYSVTVHAHDIFVDKSMLATKLRSATFVASISKFNRDYLINLLGPWVKEKIHIVRCGIDPAYYNQGKNMADDRQLDIISIGSLQPYKGFIFLIEACAQLRDLCIPFRCRIIGGGDLRSMLEQEIEKDKLEGLITLVGPRSQDEVSQLLQTANCYVQPSIITLSGKMEGIPVALMEAMVSGIPVIATAISGIPELVKDGETGWLVPPENVHAMVKALEQIFKDRAEAKRRAEQGKKWVLEEFVLTTNIRKLNSIFAEIIQLG